MLKISPAKQFEKLKAPLRNVRWSWGAERGDGKIILRAWDDEIELVGGKRHIRLTNYDAYKDVRHPGFAERLRHIEAIRDGAAGYVIICKAVAPTPRNRRIAGVWPDLTKIEGIVKHRDDLWAELGDEVPANSLV